MASPNAVAAVLIVAGVSWLAFANGVAHLNVLVMPVVLGAAIAERIARDAAAARGGSVPPGPPLSRAPARSPERRDAAGARVFVIVVASIMGFFSLFAVLVSDGCPSSGAAATRCDTQVSTGWQVLIATQLLVVITALAGVRTARSPGQLGRAALLEAAGAPVAFVLFFAAVSPALHG